jgi:hypothetical protein
MTVDLEDTSTGELTVSDSNRVFLWEKGSEGMEG